MKNIIKNRAGLVTALTVLSSFALAVTPAAAVPVLFGANNISVEGGGDTSDLAAGALVTVTGALLQLQLADGSTVTVPKGSSFRITGEGDALAIEIVSGSLRVDSKGTPITVTHNGSSITTTGGGFSAFASASGGLDGRVNGGTATVSSGGEEQEFAKGEGYLASSGGVAGTFTPPVAGAPQYASNQTQYSSADQRGPDGNAQVADDALGNGGGGYGGTPPVTGVIVPVTGTEYADRIILYAADAVGIDQRSDVTVTIGDDGELNRYTVGDGANEDLERNSNDSLERGNANGEVFIERWAGGETHGNYYNDYNGPTTAELGRTSYQGYHLAYGEPGTNTPTTGYASYTLAAATNPTFDKGQTAPGTFTGTLGLTFGPLFKVGVEFAVAMPGDKTYLITTAGGAAAPSATINYPAEGRFAVPNIAVAQGGIACPTSNCTAVVYGLIGGDAASSVGIAYQIIDFSSPPDATGRSTRLSGAAAFTQGSYDAGGGGGGGGDQAAVESGTLDAPFRTPASGTYFGNALFAPILTGQREATITHDLVFDESGAFIGFRGTSNGSGTYRLNDGVIADLAGTAYMQIGRWNGGTILKNDESYFTVGGWQGVPYLIGVPINNNALPTSGIATYALSAATAPIFASGAFAPGVFDGSAAILFGASGGNQWKIGLDATVTMQETSGEVIYNISTLGGVVDPSQSPISGSIAFYTISSPVGSSICVSTTCQVDIRSAIVGGPSGRDAGINYAIYQNSSDAIMGSALFQVIGNDVLYDQDINMMVRAIGPGNNVVTGSLGSYGAQNDTITHEDGGGLSQFGVPGNFQNYNKGTTTVTGGSANGLTWSRWSNGTATSAYLANNQIELGANQAIHTVTGGLATSLPASGTAQYTLAGATAPTIADGSAAPGTFSGTLGVAFGAYGDARVGVDFDVAIGGFTYNILTTGGSATPGTSEILLNSAGFTNSHVPVAAAGGPACTGATCEATVAGFLTGVGATGAAISYAISSNGSPNLENTVQGVAAFTSAVP
tara:strand:- start:6474 stop:9518 length:3045 start_codon:yes stop_codon:yes gene_type:complete